MIRGFAIPWCSIASARPEILQAPAIWSGAAQVFAILSIAVRIMCQSEAAENLPGAVKSGDSA
jgi:hypothetical protein